MAMQTQELSHEKIFNPLDFELKSITLREQSRASTSVLPQEIAQYRKGIFEFDENSQQHLDVQIQEYFRREPGELKMLQDERREPLERFLEVTSRITWAGSGEHGADTSTHDESDEVRKKALEEVFDLDKKPKTKCSNFNSVYIHVFETLAKQFGQEDLLTKYKLILISAAHPQDIQRFVSDRLIPHAFPVLCSLDNNETVRLTPIDAYEPDGKNFANLDKSAYRQVDAMLGFYNAFEYDINPLKNFSEVSGLELEILPKILKNIQIDMDSPEPLISLYGRLAAMLNKTNPQEVDTKAWENRLRSLRHQIELNEELLTKIRRYSADSPEIEQMLQSDLEQATDLAHLSEGELEQAGADYQVEVEHSESFSNELHKNQELLSLVINQLLDGAITKAEQALIGQKNKVGALNLLHITSSLEDLAYWGVEVDLDIWNRMSISLKEISTEMSSEHQFQAWLDSDPYLNELKYRGGEDYISDCRYELESEQYEAFVNYKSQHLAMLIKMHKPYWIEHLPKELSSTQLSLVQSVLEILKNGENAQDYSEEITMLGDKLEL